DKDREIWSYNASVPRVHPAEDFAVSLEHRCVPNATGPSFAGYTSTGHKSKGGSRLVKMDDPIGYLNDKCSGAFGATARAALASELVAGIECLPETPLGPPRAWGAGEGAVVVCDSKANCTSESNVWAMSVNYRDHDTWPTEEGEFRSCNNWCDQVICIKTEAGNSSEEGPHKLDTDEALLELSDASMPVLQFDLAPFSFAPMAELKLKLQLLPKHQPRKGIAATAVQLREHDGNAEGSYGKNGTILATVDIKEGTRGGKSLWYKFNVSAAVQSKIGQSSLCLMLTTNVSLPFGSYFTVAATESALNDRPYLVLGSVAFKPRVAVIDLAQIYLLWLRPTLAETSLQPLFHGEICIEERGLGLTSFPPLAMHFAVPGNVMLLYDESKDDFVDISHNIDIRNMLGQCCGPMGGTVVDPNGTIYGSTEWGIWQLDAADNFTWNKIDYYWGNAKLKWLGQHLFHQPRGNKFIRQNVETLRRHEIAPPTFGNSTELHLSGAVLMEG
ncbi:ABCC2, partial [Symbiodinium microadriaticum]